MLYQEYLRNELEIILKKIFSENCLNKNLSNNLNFSIDISPRKEFGDLSSNIAMVACKILKLSPIRLAEKIVNQLNKNKMILKLEIVKPGFINFFFKSLFWQNQLQEFLDLPDKFDYKIKSRKTSQGIVIPTSLGFVSSVLYRFYFIDLDLNPGGIFIPTDIYGLADLNTFGVGFIFSIIGTLAYNRIK